MYTFTCDDNHEAEISGPMGLCPGGPKIWSGGVLKQSRATKEMDIGHPRIPASLPIMPGIREQARAKKTKKDLFLRVFRIYYTQQNVNTKWTHLDLRYLDDTWPALFAAQEECVSAGKNKNKNKNTPSGEQI